jgi:hypothetical protein
MPSAMNRSRVWLEPLEDRGRRGRRRLDGNGLSALGLCTRVAS